MRERDLFSSILSSASNVSGLSARLDTVNAIPLQPDRRPGRRLLGLVLHLPPLCYHNSPESERAILDVYVGGRAGYMSAAHLAAIRVWAELRLL